MSGSRPKRSLGQNFLVDPNLQRKVVDELEAGPGDAVLEVGPGHGELSAHLIGRVAHLVLVEKDGSLAAELRERWGGRPEVEVVEGDALTLDLSALVAGTPARPYRLLSNVPYNITSPLVFRFLSLRPPPARIVLTVQREVAERMVAAPGSRTFGALSVGVQARAEAAIAFTLSRKAFRPVPDVTSACVRLDPDPARMADLPGPALRRLTRAAFGRRRKQLQKILRSAPEYGLGQEAVRALLAPIGIDPRARPEQLSAEQFVRLARRLTAGSEDAEAGREVGDAGC